ncbi:MULTISPECIES: hypothetical protein [Actinomyces]|uniref:hypothetical protein n=1 Tax=Actinomyces TaxID=1654 RepID=UPI001FBAD02A|nr:MULTISPECIES: hypothetical protein [Actinomyces]
MSSLRPVAGVLGAPLGHLQRIETRAVRDAAPAAHDGDGFPVVLYSPGLASSRFENVALMVAAVIDAEDLELLMEAAEDLADIEAAEAARTAITENGTVPWDEVKVELGLA